MQRASKRNEGEHAGSKMRDDDIFFSTSAVSSQRSNLEASLDGDRGPDQKGFVLH